MAGTASEIIPAMWDQARDGAFFRVTAGFFDTAFCAGASVLLASYDDECVPAATWPVLDTEQESLPAVAVVR